MNPWGFMVIAIGLVIMIIGVKGTQETAKSVIKAQPASHSASTSGDGGITLL